jgi:hypothetical protein
VVGFGSSEVRIKFTVTFSLVEVGMVNVEW